MIAQEIRSVTQGRPFRLRVSSVDRQTSLDYGPESALTRIMGEVSWKVVQGHIVVLDLEVEGRLVGTLVLTPTAEELEDGKKGQIGRFRERTTTFVRDWLRTMARGRSFMTDN